MVCVTFSLFAIPQHIQDIPNYCLMGTIFILSLDRHRRIKNPEKRSIPIKWALGIVWLVSLALVLPYSAYITFFDLSVSTFTTLLFDCKCKKTNRPHHTKHGLRTNLEKNESYFLPFIFSGEIMFCF